MKKELAWIFILSLIVLPIILHFAVAQDEPGNSAFPVTPQQGNDIIVGAQSKWDYLSKEWQTMLLKNPVVNAINSAFTKMDEVGFFVVLFGAHWSLSFTMLFTILLWVCSLLFLKRLFRKTGYFKKEYCWLLALFSTMILAWLQAFYYISLSVFEFPTTWQGRLVLGIVLIAAIWVLFLFDYLSGRLGKSREAAKASNAENKVARVVKFQEGFEKGTKG